MGAWDKREINFRGEGIGNRKAKSYKDSHFTWTYIQFCTLIVTAGFWVRYFELFPSVFLFALDWSGKNLVRNIIGPFIRKRPATSDQPVTNDQLPVTSYPRPAISDQYLRSADIYNKQGLPKCSNSLQSEFSVKRNFQHKLWRLNR